jgi:hypothetical protein
MTPLRTALLAQVLGALIATGLVALVYPATFSRPLAVAALQGLAAAFVSFKLEAPPWWLGIHLVFMPCVVLAGNLGLSPGWYLGAFFLLLLVFWRVDKSRVPLFLSNKTTAVTVAGLIPPHQCRVIDLGCGNGVLLSRLATLRPDCNFVGVEHAPLPWLWAWLVCLGRANCKIRYGNFWRQPLTGFDLVYAFLSPAPMSQLWAKAQAEMLPGTLLISNSFAVPDAEPLQLVDIAGRHPTHLFCYKPAAP